MEKYEKGAFPLQDLFIDGLLDVSFAKGTVRLDLYSLSATRKNKQGAPEPEFRQRLVLSGQSFAELLNGLNLAAQSLREQGVLAGGPRETQARQEGPPRLVSVPDEPEVGASAGSDNTMVTSLTTRRPKTPQSPNFPVGDRNDD